MRIILTIDDSPEIDILRLIDFLKINNIKAVFFCVGYKIEKEPELTKSLIRNGHIVANHSYSHKRFSKVKDVIFEIKKTDDLIQQIYEEMGIKWTEKYFRYPYQDKGMGWNPIKIILKNYNKKFIITQSFLKKLGYKNFPVEFRKTKNPILKFFLNDIDVFTNLNLKDWRTSKIQKILKKIDKLRMNENYILQLHDKKNNRETIEILKKFIEVDAKFVLPKQMIE